jgi:hypothetical protein
MHTERGDQTMAKGIKKINAVKKQRVIDSVDSGDRGAGDGCRVMLIKRDPVLVAIDAAFADHRLGIDSAFAESVLDGTGGAGPASGQIAEEARRQAQGGSTGRRFAAGRSGGRQSESGRWRRALGC